jgi:2-dehydro-3-deoxyphosphooctonate aldolase (KDO 8-P synthase)
MGEKLTLICGPCVIEGRQKALDAAKFLTELSATLPIQLIYKSSYDKANRSSSDSYRGPGLEEGLSILKEVKERFGVPVLTDIHSPEEARAAAKICDIIQIPAFLSRQTDLIYAAADTGCAINVKKGQFMSPWDIKNVVDKILSRGNEQILLTERGVSFGYQQLVADMRSIPIMQETGFPVCFDAAHAVQKPGGLGHATGGDPQFIPLLARAAIAAGADAIFLEAHPNPKEGLSDRDSMIPFSQLRETLELLVKLYEVINQSSKPASKA